jgi:hypothetical protein
MDVETHRKYIRNTTSKLLKICSGMSIKERMKFNSENFITKAYHAEPNTQQP